MPRRHRLSLKTVRIYRAARKAIEKAERAARLRPVVGRRRRHYVRPEFEVTVLYRGFDPNLEQYVEDMARTFGAERVGSGFSFFDGERDICYAFTKRKNQDVWDPWAVTLEHRRHSFADARRFVSALLSNVDAVHRVCVQRFEDFVR